VIYICDFWVAIQQTDRSGVRHPFIGFSGLALECGLRSRTFITIALALLSADASGNPATLSILTPNLCMRFLMADLEKIGTSEES
jgi:hypothetical protein